MSSIKYSSIPGHDVDGCDMNNYKSIHAYSTSSQRVDTDISAIRGDGLSNYKSIHAYSTSSQRVDTDISAIRERQPNLAHTIFSSVISAFCFLLLILTFPVSGWLAFKMVSERRRLVVFRLGHLRGTLGPGLVFVMPIIDRIVSINLGPRAFNVPPSRAYTKDGAVIEVGADVHFQVVDAELSVLTTQDLNRSLRATCQTALAQYLAKLKLADIQASHMTVNTSLQVEISRSVKRWGIAIARVEISSPKLLHMLPEPDALKDVKAVLSALFFGHQEQPEQGMSGFEPTATAYGYQDAPRTRVSQTTPDAILSRISSSLTEELVQSVAAVYQFDVCGEGGGSYYLDLKIGKGHVGRGTPLTGPPDVTISLSVDDMQELFVGSLKPLHAYLSGRISVSGDLQLAMKLDAVLNCLR